jgi:8-oxo-dGTP pyrophosphatase MutT (NUDIX family)
MVKLAKYLRPRGKAAVNRGTKPIKARKREQLRKWPTFTTQTVSMPLVEELMRGTDPPRSQGPKAILQSGVLAFRREGTDKPLVLLISKRRSKKWRIPKGRAEPHLSLHENAAKEAFEEAGVIGYIAPAAVGIYRSEKSVLHSPTKRIIEVWIYLLEVTDTLSDWPEKKKRITRWVTCEVAARQLSEPLLTHLCQRLAKTCVDAARAADKFREPEVHLPTDEFYPEMSRSLRRPYAGVPVTSIQPRSETRLRKLIETKA